MGNEYQVRVTTAPTVEPVTLTEAKTDLRVDHTDDDAFITSLIVAARQEAEDLARRAFVNRGLTLSLSGWPEDGVIRLPYPPVSAVGSITYYKEDNTSATMPATDYVLIGDVEPALIVLASGKSWPSDTLRAAYPVRVVYTAGYGAAASSVPERYKALIRALVAIRYESRDELTATQERQLENVRNALRMEWGW